MQLSNQSAISRSSVSFWRRPLLYYSRFNGTSAPSPSVAANDLPAPHGCHLEASGYSEKGYVRSNNEDYFRIEPDLGFYAVADGMGGAEGGEYASRLAVDTVAEQVVSANGNRNSQLLLTAVQEANRRVLEAAREAPNLKGMGTTLIAGLALGEQIHITSVGDSRAYLMDDTGLHPITQDQSWMQEVGRFLGLDEVSLQKHPMRNLLSMAIGKGASLKANNYTVHLEPSGILLLCTDGLHGVVEQAGIEEILRDTTDDRLETKCRRLVEAALAAGGPDNISVVLVRLKSNGRKKRRASWNYFRRRDALPANLWENAVLSWRQASALRRAGAIMASLMVLGVFYGPKIVPARTGPALMSVIAARATVDLTDDFHSGLSAWNGKPGWERSWSVGSSGWIQPGRLALYRETIPLTDYRLEFTGQIQSKALGFVFRAADTDNYYAAKIAVVRAGPLPAIALIHYKVIDGQAGPKKQVPVQLPVQSETVYRVLLEVHGEHYSLTLNGQLADAWSDGELRSGGIGLFAEKGEVSRIGGVHVWDKDDLLGRVALFLRNTPWMKE